MADDLSFSEIKQKIGEHLKTAMNIDNFDITFAKRQTDFSGKEIWRINIEYKKVPTDLFSNSIALTIDAKNGNIITFEKNRVWSS